MPDHASPNDPRTIARSIATDTDTVCAIVCITATATDTITLSEYDLGDDAPTRRARMETAAARHTLCRIARGRDHRRLLGGHGHTQGAPVDEEVLRQTQRHREGADVVLDEMRADILGQRPGRDQRRPVPFIDEALVDEHLQPPRRVEFIEFHRWHPFRPMPRRPRVVFTVRPPWRPPGRPRCTTRPRRGDCRYAA